MTNQIPDETGPIGAAQDAASGTPNSTAAFATPTAPAASAAPASAASASHDNAAADSTMGTQKRKNPPLFATILWGVLLIAFAGFVVVWAVLDIAPDPVMWAIITVIGAGLLLLIAGIAASLRRAG